MIFLLALSSDAYCTEKEIDCKNYINSLENIIEERTIYPYLPKELKELANKNECDYKFEMSITEECYYKNTGMSFYTYGYLPGEKEDSAAFWCMKRNDKKQPYVILIYHKHKKPEFYDCPDVIIPRGTPRPLRIYEDIERYLKNVANLPDGEHLKVRGIYSAVEVGDLYYCYKGRWYSMALD